MRLPALGDESGQDVRHHTLHGSNHDAAIKGRLVAQLLFGIINLQEDLPSSSQKDRAGFGQDRSAPEAVKELLPQLFFKINNLLAKSWLRYIALFRGPCEILCFRNGDTVSKLMNFHRKILSNQ